jgi:hypothetical protein
MRKWIAAAVLATAAVAATGSTAAASSAPIVITYAKQCDASGHCVGTTGSGGKFEMQVTSFRATGDAAHLTAWTESVTDGGISFRAELTGTTSPAGFIVLNGTVTEGSFAGAQVHQRSNLVDAAANTWTGELQIMPASA